MGETGVRAAAIERELPQVNVGRTAGMLLVAFDERELAVGENALGFVVDRGRIGVTQDLFGREIQSKHIAFLAAVGVGVEDELVWPRGIEILRLHRAAVTGLGTVEQQALRGERGLRGGMVSLTREAANCSSDFARRCRSI